MLKSTLRLSIVTALAILSARTFAQMPNAVPTAPNSWPTNDWPAPQSTTRHVPSSEHGSNSLEPTPVNSGTVTHRLLVAAQSAGYSSPAGLCEDGTCGAHSKDCGCGDCCPPRWSHRRGVFVEYMLLRPRDTEVAYAVPINGPIVRPPADPIQVGPTAVADTDHSNSFRVGVSLPVGECTSLVFAYAHFEKSNTDHSVSTDPTQSVIRPLVLHPSTFDANTDALAASAGLDVGFDVLDADYRSMFYLGECSVMNWFVGARYARLQQDFSSLFTLTGEDETVLTDVGFDGVGLRLGLDFERQHSCGLLMYGRSAFSLVAGQFSTTYLQEDSNLGEPVVSTGWKGGRMVPITDLELGVGWLSPSCRFRMTVGYSVSYWFNSVTTDQWIKAVKENDFVGQPDGMSYDTISFDGLTVRADYRF